MKKVQIRKIQRKILKNSSFFRNVHFIGQRQKWQTAFTKLSFNLWWFNGQCTLHTIKTRFEWIFIHFFSFKFLWSGSFLHKIQACNEILLQTELSLKLNWLSKIAKHRPKPIPFAKKIIFSFHFDAHWTLLCTDHIHVIYYSRIHFIPCFEPFKINCNNIRVKILKQIRCYVIKHL